MSQKRVLNNICVFFTCLVIVYSFAILGVAFASSSTTSEWYETIKPSITPPNIVFPIVWNILYMLITIAIFLTWQSSNNHERKHVATVFGVNLILNCLWSLFFFTFMSPMAAFIDIMFIWLTIVFAMQITWKINKNATYLLIPYFLWISFAVILNALSL